MNLRISPGKVKGIVAAPPSKSYTHRALLVASLAEGTSKVVNVLHADDINVTLSGLKKLGVHIEEKSSEVTILGNGGTYHPDLPNTVIDCKDSGTSLRFLTAVAALTNQKVILDGSLRLQMRPIGTLVTALKNLGVDIHASDDNYAPIRVRGDELNGGMIQIDGSKSSQFISALLLIGPLCKKDLTIHAQNLHSAPYIDITLDVMDKFGVKATRENHNYMVYAQQHYKGTTYTVEGDFSSAAYFFAAAAVTQSSVKVTSLNPCSIQADVYILTILEKMGCSITKGDFWIEVNGKPLRAIDIDMSDYPDIVPIVAVSMSYARGTSRITNIGHLRFKESDRIETVTSELAKMGIDCTISSDSIAITGGRPHSASIETHSDHRIAMSFAVAGLAADGKTIITNSQVVKKSFPDFFDRMKQIGTQIS